MSTSNYKLNLTGLAIPHSKNYIYGHNHVTPGWTAQNNIYVSAGTLYTPYIPLQVTPVMKVEYYVDLSYGNKLLAKSFFSLPLSRNIKSASYKHKHNTTEIKYVDEHLTIIIESRLNSNTCLIKMSSDDINKASVFIMNIDTGRFNIHTTNKLHHIHHKWLKDNNYIYIFINMINDAIKYCTQNEELKNVKYSGIKYTPGIRMEF